ncbi:MAG: glycosyltransferase family A protein [Planctomycetota bacterium]
MPNRPDITAILCTYNRGPEVRRTIDSLLAQDLPRQRYEVLIIDNASSPENAAILDDCAALAPDVVRVVREPTPGLCTARNRGIEESQSPYVTFLDDDALAARSWLRMLVEAFEEDPKIAIAGGRVVLSFEGGPRPDFIDRRLTPYLSAFDHGDDPVDVPALEAPRGCNIAFRKSALDEAGRFDDRMGRTGKNLASLDEIDVALRIERNGYRLRYVPGADVRHLVRTERLHRRWFRRRIRWQGRGLCSFEVRHYGRWKVLKRLPGQVGRCLWRRGVHRWLHLGYVEESLHSLLFRRAL